MKARLIKSEDVYFLVDNSEIEIDCHYLAWDPYYATGKWVRYVLSNGLNGTKQFKIIGSTLDLDAGVHKLSLKNCQAIERGYDLDELAEQEFPYDFDIPLFETLGITQKVQKSILIGMLQGTLIKGFQKAIETMVNNKFTAEDMCKAWSEGYHRKVDEINGNELRYFDKFIHQVLPFWPLK